MSIYFISLFSAIFIYLLILSFMKPSSRQLVKGRISRYFYTESAADVEDQFMREKLQKMQEKKDSKFELASKEFSDYLAMSGIKLRATEFMYIWIALTFVPMLLIILFGGNGLTALAFLIIGFAVPPFLVNITRKKRQQTFQKQLGESLVIMSNCIKSGFTFLQAMESIANDMQPPISTEFAKVLREMRFGVNKNDALRHMVDRVKNEDLKLLVSAVLTAEQVGGNLSDILDIISNTVRDRIKIKQEIRVLTAQGKVSGFIIGLLPVFILLMVMILNPTYFKGFFGSSIGQIMIVVSVLMEAIGFFVINKIIDIEY